LGLVVADVSGKGVAAAFFMAVTRTMLRGVALTSRTPSECMEHVNDSLCSENPMEMFVTAVYADLHEASGLVTLVNAGHCEPIVARADGSVELLRRSGNPPLGVMAQRSFAELSFTLGEGEMLFFYTDGVTEAFDAKGDLFKVQRLLEITRNSGARSPNELMLAVIGGVENFSAGTLQYDDITCLVIRRNAVAAV
jgi:sigma-B regulation protein RsbU (phosphoserine phosphatase)